MFAHKRMVDTLLRRKAARIFLRINEWLWRRLPAALVVTRALRWYGGCLHSLVQRQSSRAQYHGTFFLRNRPELELIRKLANRKPIGSTLKLAVLACSNGAEVYSIVWAIRSARPDLNVITSATDVSPEILEIAKSGIYSIDANELMDSAIFERLSDEEMQGMFDREGRRVKIKSWLQEGIDWQVANAANPSIADQLGKHDVVVANRFLCHMPPDKAEECLRNLSQLVRPGGYLFVSGVDLDVRTKVARELGWSPVQDGLEEIHDGDCSVRRDWPWRYWGLEPLNKRRSDWKTRYAAVFELNAGSKIDTTVCLEASEIHV